MNKYTYLIPVAAIAVSGALLYGSVQAKAATASNWRESLVQTLASKLGVDQSKVQTAFSDIRMERRAEAKSRFEERLSELVTLGKITESQKTAILNKKAELQKEWDADEVKREEHRAELTKWADANGIDLSVAGFGMGMGKGDGMGMGRGRGNW